MKRCRLKRTNFQIINKMNKENETSDKQQNGNDFIADVSSSIKCSKCRVNNQQPSHSCPFAEEINNDSSSLCDCCSDCEHECCMDI